MSQSERLWTIVALAGVAVVFALVAVALLQQRARRRRAELQEHFGPEYDRAVEELGNSKRAARELSRRAERVDHYRLHELEAADRRQFSEAWSRIQARFVDEPAIAVTSANELINQ